ncbi:MAG: DMT family transporter [Burkholderiaceae bacterium]|nr:DMT family transporter [Burkholderiaceae bacterium]
MSPPHGERPLRALAYLTAAQVCFVLLDATGKRLAGEIGIPLVSLVRHAGHALLMFVFFAPTLGAALWRTKRPGTQLLRGLSLAGFTLFFFTALGRLPQADATAINFIAPFAVMLLAGPLLGERVGWPRWMGAALGFVGMLLVVRPGANLDPTGVVFVLLTVVCNVAFQLLTRSLAITENSLATIFLSSLVGVTVSAAVLPLQSSWGGWPESLDPQQLALLASLGVTGIVSQWFWIRAYYWASASLIAPLVFLQIFWATAAGWGFFGQLPSTLSFVGMALIGMAGAAAMLLERSPRSYATAAKG